MSADVAMDILPIFMIVAVAASIALGFFLGRETDRVTAWAVFRARREARRARAAQARAEGERALFAAQRDDLRAQLDRANAVIDETTHAVHRAGSAPDLVDDPGTEALMRAVTDEHGRALGSAPAGRHHAQEDDDEPWPCRVATTNPLPALPGAPLYCEHPDGHGHDGEHFAAVLGTTHTWAGGAE